MLIANSSFFHEVSLLLSEGRPVTLRAKGDSMYPFIVGGRDSVVLHPVAQVRAGDIVLACLPSGSYVLHRVHRMEPDGTVVLMGDGNVGRVERCHTTDICGTVHTILRNGRHVECHSSAERCKVRLWLLLLPLRRYILAVRRRWKRWRDRP